MCQPLWNLCRWVTKLPFCYIICWCQVLSTEEGVMTKKGKALIGSLLYDTQNIPCKCVDGGPRTAHKTISEKQNTYLRTCWGKIRGTVIVLFLSVPQLVHTCMCVHACVCVRTPVCVLVNICLLVIYRRRTGVRKSSWPSKLFMILSPYFKGGTNIVTQHNKSSN